MGIFTLRWRGALHEYKGIRAGVDGVDDVLDLGVVVEELDVGPEETHRGLPVESPVSLL